MLSPVKAVIAGAFAAFGGLFLIAQPFDQQNEAVPAAQGTEASGVTVAQDCGSLFATPIVCTWTASDPRVAGRMTHE